MVDARKLTIAYRPDVDGLRAFAVISVLIFHFFPESLKGGFAGVDVFFVISGYLVTKIIFRQMEQGRFSLSEFYFNRARRLFPSLFVVLLAVFLAGWLFLFSSEFLALARHLLAGAFFASNILLFTESGYFDSSSDLKPLLHLWSLGIEEQFYFLWPFCMGTLFIFLKRRMALVLMFLSLVSFVFCVGMTKVRPDLAFYMLPARLWELAAGGVLAVSGGYQGLARDALGVKVSRAWFAGLANVLPWLGFLMILFSFFCFHRGNGFPGWRAAIPVLGTLLVLAGGVSSSLNRILAYPVFVYIGLISYPLYLWHWPLISYAHIVRGVGGVSFWQKIFLIALSFALAAFSYEVLEKRFKKARFSPFMAALLCIAMVLFALLGAGTIFFRGFPERYLAYEKQVSSRLAFEDGYKTKVAEACRSRYLNIELCAVATPGAAAEAILIGDSHANHLFPGLEKQFQERGLNLLLLGRSGAPPFYGVVSKRAPDSSLDDVFRYIDGHPEIKTVVLSAFWGNYFNENGVMVENRLYKNRIEDSAMPSVGSQAEIFKRGLERTLVKLERAGKGVIVLLSIAPMVQDYNNCFSRPFGKRAADCNFLVSEHSDAHIYKSEMMAILAKHPKVQVLDPVPLLCPGGRCSFVHEDIAMYSDGFHLSESSARRLWERMSIGRK